MEALNVVMNCILMALLFTTPNGKSQSILPRMKCENIENTIGTDIDVIKTIKDFKNLLKNELTGQLKKEINHQMDYLKNEMIEEDQLKKQMNETICQLKKKTNETVGQLEETKEKIGQLKKEMNETNETNGQLRKEIYETNETIGQLRKEMNKTIGQLKKEMNETMGQLKKEMKNETIDQLKEETMATIGQLKKEVNETNETIDQLRKETNKIISRLKEETKEIIGQLRKEINETNETNETTGQLRKEMNKTIGQLKKETNDTIGQFKKMNEAIGQLKEETMKTIGQLKKEINETNETIDQLRNEMNETIVQLRKEMNETNETIGQLRKETNKTIGQLKKKSNETIGQLKEKTNETIGQLKKETNKTIGQLRKDINESIGQLKEDTNHTRGQLKKEMNETICQLKKEFNETFRQLKKKTKETFRQLKKETKETIGQLKEELTEVTNMIFPRIAFHAVSTSDQGLGVIVFKQVLTNIGNAYDNMTGIFTALYRGTYIFSWSVETYGVRTDTVLEVNGMVNGSVTADESATYYDTSTTFAVLELQEGDTVNIRVKRGTAQSTRTMFSGWQYKSTEQMSAFYVSLTSRYNGSVFLFDKVHTNKDSVYTPNDGYFTAPRDGIYVFTSSISVYGSKEYYYNIYTKGLRGPTSWVDSSSGQYDNTGSMHVAYMSAGEKAYVGPYRNNEAESGSNFAGWMAAPGSPSNYPAFIASLQSRSSSSPINFSKMFISPHTGFDSSTGIFTATLHGMYVFLWNIEAHNIVTTTSLRVNGVDRGQTRSDGRRNGYDDSAAVSVVELEIGDRVSVIILSGKAYGGRQIFCGWLLFKL